MRRLYVATADRVLAADDREGWSASTVFRGTETTALSLHPAAPTRPFLGTTEGLYRSADAGETWTRLDVGAFEHAHVTAVAIAPGDPDVVYAGTEPSRVYRSADGGDTWQHRDGLRDLPSADEWSFPPRPDTHHVRWIEVDPRDVGRIHVAIEAGALIRSSDGGRTWRDRVEGARRDVHSMATHPDRPGHVWCAAGDGYAESDDGGDTWYSPDAGLGDEYCWSVAVDPGDPETAVLSAAAGPRAAHRSASADSTVHRRSGDGGWRPVDGLPTGEGVLRYVLAPGVAPGTFYAASNTGLFGSDDGGVSWDPLPVEWPADLDARTVAGLAVAAR
ncbi:MAG: WD40/YVTN/BNR-like repeat-containing protein [Halanaeroarchaeum sp.]